MNTLIDFTSSVPALAVQWAVNGLVQVVCAGASAKMLIAWFPAVSRGRYWALWSTSENVVRSSAPTKRATPSFKFQKKKTVKIVRQTQLSFGGGGTVHRS